MLQFTYRYHSFAGKTFTSWQTVTMSTPLTRGWRFCTLPNPMIGTWWLKECTIMTPASTSVRYGYCIWSFVFWCHRTFKNRNSRNWKKKLIRNPYAFSCRSAFSAVAKAKDIDILWLFKFSARFIRYFLWMGFIWSEIVKNGVLILLLFEKALKYDSL